MSHIAAGYSGDHSRDKQITLPPIRDIFREQLTSPSPRSSPRPPRPSYNNGSVRPAVADESSSYSSTSSRAPSSSPDMRYIRGESPWGSTPSPRSAPSGLRSSHSYGAASPEVSSRWPMSEHAGSRRSSPALPAAQPYPPVSGYRYVPREAPGHYYGAPSGPSGVDDPRPSTAVTSVWTEHRRRDSAESAWSSHSSSSGGSSGLRSIPPSNALQFQPLPHAQMASTYPRPQNHVSTHHPANLAPVDYQSPFGVLIADVDPPGVSSADPQRTAIIRTLRASGAQGSFQINFDDPANAHNAPRYSCQYCGKGFARPSSLRIHNNSHTGEKPFECTHPGCDRRFSVHSNMRRHARVHEGDAPRQGESSGDEVADE